MRKNTAKIRIKDKNQGIHREKVTLIAVPVESDPKRDLETDPRIDAGDPERLRDADEGQGHMKDALGHAIDTAHATGGLL